MKQIRSFISDHNRLLTVFVLVLIGLAWLLLHRLGSLTGGLSLSEWQNAKRSYGWHGLYNQPFYLPLTIIRSIVFVLFPRHGQSLTRLPNVLFGALTIVSFTWLVRLWHGTRTALFAGLLFTCSAWTLHVSRLASNDILYLWVAPTLLLAQLAQQRRPKQAMVFYGSLALLGLLLYIPGLVWLVLLSIFWQRSTIKQGWQYFDLWWQRSLYVLTGIIWLPLLLINLTRAGNIKTWLGLPQKFPSATLVIKHLIGVPVHLFVRGPQYPQLWLGRAPLLDVFTLVMSLLGIYFYATRWKAQRSRILGSFLIVGVILVGLGGPVSLSLLIPIIYFCVAIGITYFLHEWLQVFPRNPLARSLGIGLIALAIAISCLYNLRAYFVAWPNNPTTQTTFRYHR